VWVTDITYVPTDEGWLYLAGHKDLFNSEVVGYAMGERLSKNLVEESLLRALSSRKPQEGLLHHSDRGVQYCSGEYQSLLKRFGLEVSMSRSGNCYDNAPMESFWGILKQELIHHRHYRTRREAMEEIRSILRSFITGRGCRLDWVTCHRRHMPGNTTVDWWQHEEVWCTLLPSDTRAPGSRHTRGSCLRLLS
jgi:putative transposase